MRSRLAATLVALALGGCANPSGEWVLRAPRLGSGSADAIRLDLQPGGIAVGTIERGGVTVCPERYTHEQTGRCFTNAVGQIVVSIECVHEVRSCEGSGTNTVNLCSFFDLVVPGPYEQVGETLVSRSRTRPGVVLERSR